MSEHRVGRLVQKGAFGRAATAASANPLLHFGISLIPIDPSASAQMTHDGPWTN